MDRDITRTAARLRWGLIVAMVVMGLLYLAARLELGLGPARVEFRDDGLTPAAGRMVADGTMLLLLVALVRLAQMLRLVESGELFSAAVIRHFRGFAFWLLLMALYGFLAPIVFTVAAGPREGSPHRMAFILDLREVLTLGITLLLFLLAKLLERAREIEAEMREIV